MEGILQKAGTPNKLKLIFRGRIGNEVVSTPFRCTARREKQDFLGFIAFVEMQSIDFHDFANEEAPLLDDGWTPDMIITLIESVTDCPDGFPKDLMCKHCADGSFHKLETNLSLWVKYIKFGIDPKARLCSSNRQTKGSLSISNCKPEEECRRHEMELECCPGLLNISLGDQGC